MNLADALLRTAAVYCEVRKIERATLSGLALKDSRVLDRIAAGGSITIRNFERCMRWLSEHWPAETAWPEDINRPLPADAEPEQAAE